VLIGVLQQQQQQAAELAHGGAVHSHNKPHSTAAGSLRAFKNSPKTPKKPTAGGVRTSEKAMRAPR
jgi:hypothetical protein